MATKTFTPKELASELGTDAKSLRKFLRDFYKDHEIDTPGQGGRYAISGKQAQQIRKAFTNRPTKAKTTETAEIADVEVDGEVEEIDANGDVELEDLVDEEG